AAGNAAPTSAPYSVTTAATQDTSAPTMPSGLTSTGVTASQVTLSWQPSTDDVGVVGYRGYLGSTLAGTATSTTFSGSRLRANTSDSFSVSAYDAAGNSSPQSAFYTTTTGSNTPAGSSAAIATYDFDAGAGTTLADRSGNNHSGTLVSGPIWTA